MTREEAKSEIKKVFEPAFANYIITALVEGATPSERKTGKWIVVSDGYGNGESTAHICECSECKDTVWVYKDADRIWNYCPHCGAKMEGAEE